MDFDQGVLHTVPIPEAMAYIMLRPLLHDVAEDDMCGVAPGKTFPANDTWHPLLMEALTGIPSVQPGDSVWWHCDMIHSVSPVHDQKGWGNVIYIPAAPSYKNEEYATSPSARPSPPATAPPTSRGELQRRTGRTASTPTI